MVEPLDVQAAPFKVGDGSLIGQLAASGAQVVGVDLSREMVAARRRGIDARVEHGARLPFAGEFDAVFSNAALHLMHPLDDVLAASGVASGPEGGSSQRAAVTATSLAVAAALTARGVDAYAGRRSG